MENIKAVIFDADGVVMHGEWFSKRYSEKFGIPLEDIMIFFDNEFQDCLVGKADLKEVILPHLQKWGWKGTVEEVLQFWFGDGYQLDKEMIDFIRALKSSGKICILATNQEKHRVLYMKSEMGLGKVFDYTISSADTGCKKDTPEFYKELFKLLPEMKPGEMLFFDDRQKNIDTANSLGIKALLFKNLEDSKKYF